MTLDDEIRALEERLLSPDVRRSRLELEALLAPDFIEYGSSGRTFDRAGIIDLLAAESPVRISLESFGVKHLSDDIALATYTSHARGAHGTRTALRSSIWSRRGARWQLVFHQGTLKA